ncbi:MAG: tetratricopeptide repeat protein [Chloroflexota bacterium]|nr:tetratricopeptide repeat protein [Chloroflexota bacterium]
MSKGNRDWLDLIKKVPGWITGAIALVTALVGFIQLCQGNTGLVTVVLLVTGLSGGILLCAYVAFGRTPPLVEGGAGVWQYPNWRPWALVGLIVIPLLMAGGVGYYFYRQTQPSDKIIILVADLDGPDPEHYGVTEIVLRNLRQAMGKYDDVQVEALGRAITEAEGSSAARAVGAKHDAAIVIWGWYRPTEEVVALSVHFEPLGGHEWETDILEVRTGEKPVQRYPAARLKSFDLQMQLSSNLECLTLLTTGLAWYYREDLQGAIGRFSDALARDTTNTRIKSRLHFFRGTAYLWSGADDQAIADYASAIKADPTYAAAYSGLGLAYARLGVYDQAIAAYDVAVQLDPSHAAAYDGRGRAYAALGDYEQALSNFKQAIDRDYAPAYVGHGNIHFNTGDFEGALADYQHAIEIDSEYALAHSHLGYAQFTRRNYKAAISALKKAIELYEAQGEHAPIENYYALGLAYFYLDRCDQALQWFERALEIDPGDENALEGIRLCEEAEVAH